jgi:hypothetical protein
LQQPLGQLVGVQAHPPSTHSWPLTQTLPEPQVQLPAEVQVSVMPVQMAQAAPSSPQLPGPGVSQADPLQHPSGQLEAVQAQPPSTQT